MVWFRAVIVRCLLWRMLRCGRVLSACARAGGCAIVFPWFPVVLRDCLGLVSVAELADALDLGSSAFGRVGSTPTGRTSGRSFRSFLLPLTLHSCYNVSERG